VPKIVENGFERNLFPKNNKKANTATEKIEIADNQYALSRGIGHTR
jgi:hypothetical protein